MSPIDYSVCGIEMRDRMKKIRSMLGTASLLCLSAAVLALPEQIALGIRSGIEVCLSTIIPSLFPMMLVSIMAVESGLAQRVGKWLSPVSNKLFYLPGEAGSAVLLSVIGGYPAGAKAVTELYERGAVSREQAGRMSLFCFCAGPGFLVGLVGGLTGNRMLGWLLVAVQMAAVLLTGVLFGRIGQKKDENLSENLCINGSSSCGITEALVSSAGKAAKAILQVCLYVIIFSAFNEMLDGAGVSRIVVSTLEDIGMRPAVAEAVLPVLLEVTGGCVRAAGAGLPLVAFAVGFGGLSVIMQVISITEKVGVNRWRFFAARVFQGTISAVLTAMAMELLPGDLVMTASGSLAHAELSGSPQGAVMLVVMCAMCVLCLPESEKRKYEYKA